VCLSGALPSVTAEKSIMTRLASCRVFKHFFVTSHYYDSVILDNCENIYIILINGVKYMLKRKPNGQIYGMMFPFGEVSHDRSLLPNK
jgi:hypothetical protein